MREEKKEVLKQMTSDLKLKLNGYLIEPPISVKVIFNENLKDELRVYLSDNEVELVKCLLKMFKAH